MKEMNYKKVYTDYFNYCEQDFVSCEICGQQCVDVHHIIYKSQGGKDIIDNLIGLCRGCHNEAHDKKISVDELQVIHYKFIEDYERQ